jgi:hypothetical protein
MRPNEVDAMDSETVDEFIVILGKYLERKGELLSLLG